jgi:hypothetical protein
LKKYTAFDLQTLAHLRLCWLAVVVLGTALANRANAEPFHTIYYHAVQGSFWAQLADDTGAAPTPRERAIASINDNFRAIKALGFETVTIALADSDSWVSAHGGGFSYDPTNPSAARPEFAVAQEIVLRLADANQLKVIYVVSFSQYRRSTDGRPAWAGLADEYDSTSRPPGAYDYIHCLLDPTPYYGTVSTTRLSTVGLSDGPIQSHIGDARIVGWLLAPEWNPNVVTAQGTLPHEYIFKKYWNFFYALVHDGGANTAFAGTYVIGQLAGGQEANIKAVKQWFAPGTGIQEPDRIGVEFYANADSSGTGDYNLASTYQDLNAVIDAMEKADPRNYPDDFAISADRVFLGEGNTDQTTTPGINQFFQEILQVLTNRTLAGVEFWVTDSLGNASDAAGNPTLSLAQPGYDLFTTTFSPSGIRTYAGLPPGIFWHGTPGPGGSYGNPADYPAYSGTAQPSAYGKWSYTGLTSKGHWVQQAMADHAGDRNLRFFANPNPISGVDGSGSTRLYWDASKMPAVESVAIHEGTILGPLIAEGGAKGQTDAGVPVKDGKELFLIDTTTGAHGRLLGEIITEVQ